MSYIKGWQFKNTSTSTSGFDVVAGKYAAQVVATFGGGTVKLQRLSADASTYVSVSSTTDFSAAGFATVDLPQGTYRFTVATATGVYAELVPIVQVHNDA